MGLCTLAQVKARFDFTSTDATRDALLTAMIASVSHRLGVLSGRMHAGRAVLEKSTLTQLLSPGRNCETLYLAAWPIVEVEEVLEAEHTELAEADALVEGTDFIVDSAQGSIVRIGLWLPGPLTVSVEYTGGYTTPEQAAAVGYEAEDGEVLLPEDIADAAAKQVQFEFQRRSQLGLASAGAAGGSFATAGSDAILPEVAAVMASYRRTMGP